MSRIPLHFPKGDSQKSILFPVVLGIAITVFLNGIFQSTHTLLYDFSYLVNISGRIAEGDLPYRDFDLVVSPGIFYLQAVFFEIFGRTSFAVLMLSMTISLSCFAITTRLVIQNLIPSIENRILLRTYQIVVILVVSLLGVNWIVSFPIYDALGVLLVLLNISVCMTLIKRFKSSSFYLFGLTLSLTFFAKQNIGLGYMAGGAVLLLIILVKTQLANSNKVGKLALFVLGLITTPSIFLAILIRNGMYEDYFYQNFSFASEVKGITLRAILIPFSEPTFMMLLAFSAVAMLFKFRRIVTLLEVAPVLFGGALSLIVILSTAFVGLYDFTHINWPLVVWLWILASLLLFCTNEVIYSEIPTAKLCLATLLLFGLTATYISHGYKGSSYATGPLFALACALVCHEISQKSQRIGYVGLISSLIIATWFPIYALSAHRYASPNFAKQTYSYLQLPEPVAFISVPANTESDFRALLTLLQRSSGSVLQLPAEDPLFLLSPELKPWSKCSQFIFMTCTITDDQILKKLKLAPPDILIIKKEIQLEWNPEPVSVNIWATAEKCFNKVLENATYSVFEGQKRENGFDQCT